MPPAETVSYPPGSGAVNSLVSVLGLALPLLVFFLVTPFLLRRLGLESFGVLTLFMAAVAVVSSLDFGLGQGGVRSLGRILAGGRTDEFLDSVRQWWSAYLLLGVCVALLMIVVGPTLGKALGIHRAMEQTTGRLTLYAFSATVFFGYAGTACQLVARAQERFVGITLIQTFYGVALWAGIALIVGQDGGIDDALIWISLSAALAFLLQAGWAASLVRGIRWMPTLRFDKVLESGRYSLHAFWSQLAGSVTYQADKFIVSYFLGPASVGYYGVVTNLASKLLMLVAMTAGFVFPRTVRLSSSGNDDGVRTTYLRATRYVLLVSWPAFTLGMLLAGRFLEVWLGAEAATAMTLPLRLLILAYFINSLSVVASNVFNGLGNAGLGARFSTVGALISALGCIVLAPIYGLPGAALASLLASLQVFVYQRLLHQRLGLRPVPQLGLWLRLAAAGACQVAVVWLGFDLAQGWVGLFLVGVAGWVAFYAVWFGLGLADKGDRDLVSRLVRALQAR